MKSDLQRIIDLPVHCPDDVDLTRLVVRPGALFRKKPAKLLPVQSRFVQEGLDMDGALGFIGVGHGKTLTILSLAYLLSVQKGIPTSKMLLLLPSSVRADFYAQWAEYVHAFRLPAGINIKTYDELSNPNSTAYLEQLKPEAIFCDEADALRNFTASRTNRFMRYLKKNSIWYGGKCRLYALSGTLQAKSIGDWAHLAKYALGPNSPAPIEYRTLELFREVLDDEDPLSNYLDPLVDAFGEVDDSPRIAFRNRLLCTRGVVVTQDGSVDSVALTFRKRNVYVPPEMEAHMEKLVKMWELPNGEMLESALEIHAKSIELSQGFYHEYVWPDGQVNEPWLQARRRWCREVQKAATGGHAGYDSAKLLWDACVAEEMGGFRDKNLDPALREAYYEWKDHRDTPPPPTRAVWLSYYLVLDTLQWLKQQTEPVLVWCASPEMSDMLDKWAPQLNVQLKNLGVGPKANAWLASRPKPINVIVSSNSHYRGKNLQQWSRNFLITPPSGGSLMEQLAGRSHRQGQDTAVEFDVNQHTEACRKAWASCETDARGAEGTIGVKNKLNHAVVVEAAELVELPADWPLDAMVPPGYRRRS